MNRMHALVEQMATSRAKMAEPQAKKKGGRLLCLSLLGRLVVMELGLTTALRRRRAAADQERLGRRERELPRS